MAEAELIPSQSTEVQVTKDDLAELEVICADLAVLASRKPELQRLYYQLNNIRLRMTGQKEA